jgi:hypothetical protein
MAIDRYLDVMALGLNDQQHGETTKLSSADVHMLASYCFDLTRKQHYLYMALRLSGSGEPHFEYVLGRETIVIQDEATLAQAIYKDTQFVEDAAERLRQEMGTKWDSKSDWEVRARALQDVIIRQWRAIVGDHRGLFETLGQPIPEYIPAPGAGESRSPSSEG